MLRTWCPEMLCDGDSSDLFFAILSRVLSKLTLLRVGYDESVDAV